MVWVENEHTNDFEKEEAARTAMTNFVDDGKSPNKSDPNLTISHDRGYGGRDSRDSGGQRR